MRFSGNYAPAGLSDQADHSDLCADASFVHEHLLDTFWIELTIMRLQCIALTNCCVELAFYSPLIMPLLAFVYCTKLLATELDSACRSSFVLLI